MIKYKLFEDVESDDFHIYIDDATGSYYYFDGTQLIKLGDKPTIGSKGNQRLQDDEEKKRQEQEKIDAENSDGDDGFKPETEEERRNRIKEIESDLADNQLSRYIDDESGKRVKAEKQKKKEFEKAQKAAKGIEGFKLSLRKFIKNQVSDTKVNTYSRINKKYANSKVIKPGVTRHGPTKVPLLSVYFDQSSSWQQRDIEVGMQALKSIDDFVKDGKLKVNIYYFSNQVSTTPPGGGGTNTPAVVEHIKDTHPDNVIIMTDSDGEYYRNDQYKTAVVPGAVWFLWRNSTSPTFSSHVIGKQEKREFMI